MIVLAFDTATRATAVALAGAGGTGEAIEARDDPPPGARPSHASRLLPLAAELLDRSRIGWHEVDRIAVGVGPGTFTGLRIGVATARALAQALGAELVGVSTLQSLAAGARDAAGEHPVLAVLDARRGEVFAAGWRDDATLLEPRACRPETLVETVERLEAAPLAVGDGAVEFREVLERSGAVIPADDSELHRVSAGNHCRIARTLQPAVPEAVRPEYLRLPDAEVARRLASST